ncbi:spermidine/putrescine ABC transporter ATP-binding subunit [Angulomicrobium tetraedrale]|uniref:Spermidine/putrescine import ATP-binding protein PotA n=1 Tax=Ancylobacter tetraedralis TaxID=217068 RepID=A0A839Z8V4_9HYPH|nr:ABC transporter ATP-binding protein [Ancylobacter tetraedralis]MBB3771296.1 spermidine/putrescine ABC transporter ATP-binding subunit [Ancylobacter tetraedralis]
MTSLLSIRHVEKHFGRVRAVNGVSLDIRENEFFALLGSSGSGKTTLLRMLAGFETLSGGQILLNGRDISNVPPNHRPVNLMFQSYALFPHMTVAQNIAYGLEMEKLPRAEIRARVDEILGTIQLSALAARKPEQLSGGQRQRVALARALVKRPQLLLLDEPLGALDKKLRSEMQLELKRIQHQFGITFIIVTHDQEEALVMADRIAILQHGELVQCAPPREVYEHPATRFAAEFIGVMNVFPVQRDGMRLTAADGSLIHASIPEGLGAEIVAAVRPERLRLDAETCDNRLSGRIIATAYHGLDLQVHVATPAMAKPMVCRVTADAAEARNFRAGDLLTLGWNSADTRLFAA